MLRKGRLSLIALLALLAAFVWGVARFYMLRYEVGDVYAEYSTYRTDPVGAKALYEAMGRIPGISVSRNINTFERLVGGARKTFFVLGNPAELWWVDDAKHISPVEQLMNEGGRVVVSFVPTRTRVIESQDLIDFRKGHRHKHKDETKGEKDKTNTKDDKKTGDKAESEKTAVKEDDGAAKKPMRSDSQDKAPEVNTGKEKMQRDDADADEDDNDDEDEESYTDFVDLRKQWGVKIETSASEAIDPDSSDDDSDADSDDNSGKAAPALTATRTADSPLPGEIAWHTIAYFGDLDKSWKTLYERKGKPVIIERPFGNGTLVFSADTYFLSNEGLRSNRYPTLLSWVAGPNSEIVFDETHLGVEEDQGIMTLARRYRLHGFLLGFVLLAVLYVWKNVVSVAPQYEDELPAGIGYARGKDSAEAFVNLVRRGVPPAQLLSTCLEEWRRTLGLRRADSERKYKRMAAIVDAERGKLVTAASLVEAYRAMARIVAERD